MNGNIIKEKMPEKLTEILMKARKTLATNDKLSQIGRYWLMMSLEISNCRFGLLPNEVNQFYVKQLGDKAMSHIKKLNTELSIQTAYQNMVLDSVQSNINVLQPVNNPQNWEAPKASATEDKPIQQETSFETIGTWEQPKQEKTPRPILGVGARLKQSEKPEEKADDWDNYTWDLKKSEGSKNWNKPRKNPKGWEHDDRLETDYNQD